jgi:hypothetical protein
MVLEAGKLKEMHLVRAFLPCHNKTEGGYHMQREQEGRGRGREIQKGAKLPFLFIINPSFDKELTHLTASIHSVIPCPNYLWKILPFNTIILAIKIQQFWKGHSKYNTISFSNGLSQHFIFYDKFSFFHRLLHLLTCVYIVWATPYPLPGRTCSTFLFSSFVEEET